MHGDFSLVNELMQRVAQESPGIVRIPNRPERCWCTLFLPLHSLPRKFTRKINTEHRVSRNLLLIDYSTYVPSFKLKHANSNGKNWKYLIKKAKCSLAIQIRVASRKLENHTKSNCTFSPLPRFYRTLIVFKLQSNCFSLRIIFSSWIIIDKENNYSVINNHP